MKKELKEQLMSSLGFDKMVFVFYVLITFLEFFVIRDIGVGLICLTLLIYVAQNIFLKEDNKVVDNG